jgi:hypothetical protein
MEKSLQLKQQSNEEQLHFCHILPYHFCKDYAFLRSGMVDFPTFQMIHPDFGSQLKEYEGKLTKLEDLPAYLDRLVERHGPLSSGVCLAIDAISCSSTLLNAYEVRESDDSYIFLVILQPLHPDAKCQRIFCASSKTGNGLCIQGAFDQIVTKIKMQIPVPALSFIGDPTYNFRHNDFSSCGSALLEKKGEISTSYSSQCMVRT